MTAHQDVAGVVERLRDSAKSCSQATWMMADAKTSRNRAAEGEANDGPGYMGLEPEQTNDWKAADLIESLSKALSEAEAQADKYCEWWREKRNECIAAESRLAEAMKVIEPFAAMPGCYEMHEDDVIYKNAGAALTAGDFRAARRFLNAGKE